MLGRIVGTHRRYAPARAAVHPSSAQRWRAPPRALVATPPARAAVDTISVSRAKVMSIVDCHTVVIALIVDAVTGFL